MDFQKRDEGGRRFGGFKPSSQENKSVNVVPSVEKKVGVSEVKKEAHNPRVKSKSTFKSFIEKLGFGGPPEMGNRKRRKKFVVVGTAVIVVLIIVFLMGGNLTGFSVANLGGAQDEINSLRVMLNDSNEELENVESDLAAKGNELLAMVAELEQVKGTLNLKENELKVAGEKLMSYEESGTKTLAEIEKLEDEKDDLENEKNKLNEALESSVRTICCSFSDIRKNELVNWEIVDDVIICEGQYDISCGSGNTNFDE